MAKSIPVLVSTECQGLSETPKRVSIWKISPYSGERVADLMSFFSEDPTLL